MKKKLKLKFYAWIDKSGLKRVAIVGKNFLKITKEELV
jgi:hypothetical protein